MTLRNAATSILTQLATLVRQLDAADFSRPCQTLGSATIGQHIRHTLEFFTCLESGSTTGVVNYDRRSRDELIETDRGIALNVISRLMQFVGNVHENAPLQLQVGYDPEFENFEVVQTNVMRELAYNIEHAVHHMAIIKIGVRELAPYVRLDESFGIAASTIRHARSANKVVG